MEKIKVGNTEIDSEVIIKDDCRFCGGYVARKLRKIGVCYNCRWARCPRYLHYSAQVDKYWEVWVKKYG